MFDWVLNIPLGVVYETLKARSQRMRIKIRHNTFLVFKMQIHLLAHLNFVKNVPSLIQDLVHGEAKNCFWFCRFQ